MDALLAKASEALPPGAVAAMAANAGLLTRAMADEVERVLPGMAADANIEAILGDVLDIVFGALLERRALTGQEADRLNAIWGREIAEHGWTIDDVVELNRVVTLAAWEASLPLLAQVPDFDRARIGDLAVPLVRAVDASGPYIAATHSAATERLVVERRERRRRLARAALTGARSDGDLRRQARDLGVLLAERYVVCAIRTRDDSPVHVHSAVITQWETRLGDSALLAEVDDAVVVAIPADDDDGAKPDRIRQIITQGISALGGAAGAGISSVVDGVAHLPRALREASMTAELVERTQGPGSIGRFGDHLVDHILLGDTSLLERLVEDVLRPVLKERSAAALLDTLDAYFANDGNASRVASALGLHRHTIDYRISRLRDLLGRELPLTRPELQLALVGERLLRTSGARGVT